MNRSSKSDANDVLTIPDKPFMNATSIELFDVSLSNAEFNLYLHAHTIFVVQKVSLKNHIQLILCCWMMIRSHHHAHLKFYQHHTTNHLQIDNASLDLFATIL